MPPSINESYANNWKTGKGRYKTPQYLAFENAVKIWAIKNYKHLDTSKKLLKDFPFLSFDVVFYFPESRIMTKKGLPKRLDHDNRLKALFDSLCKLLDLDDCCIWHFSGSKLIANDNYVNIRITSMNKDKLYAPISRQEQENH